MKKSEFISFIENPDLLNASQIPALKQICADFPFFANAHVLLAKALFNENHYEFEKQLNVAALHAPNREVLYYYLNKAEVDAETNEAVLETRETILDSELVEDLKNQLIEMQVDLAITTEVSEVNTTIVTLEIEEEEMVEPVPTIVHIANQAEVVEPQPEVSQDFNANEPHSFLEWLNYTNQHHTLPITIEETKVVEDSLIVKKETNLVANEAELSVEEEILDKTTTTEETILTTSPVVVTAPVKVTQEEIEEAVAKSNVNQFHSILDRFIKENPSISRPKAEFFNPQNKAKQSVEEDEDLVTETLANLYYKQGNLKKAIRAYEKLCLLYPSKMTYFASLINKIKTELKD